MCTLVSQYSTGINKSPKWSKQWRDEYPVLSNLSTRWSDWWNVQRYRGAQDHDKFLHLVCDRIASGNASGRRIEEITGSYDSVAVCRGTWMELHQLRFCHRKYMKMVMRIMQIVITAGESHSNQRANRVPIQKLTAIAGLVLWYGHTTLAPIRALLVTVDFLMHQFHRRTML